MAKKSAFEEKSITDLKRDDKNPNAHSEKGNELLRQSIRRLGAGRSIVIDKKGKIIAGNATADGASIAGIKDVIIVKSDGTKLVAVQRDDLDLDTDPRARELSIVDNKSSIENIVWDPKVLKMLKDDDQVDLNACGISDEELKKIFAEAESDDQESEQPRIKPRTATLFISLSKKERVVLDKASAAKNLNTAEWAKGILLAESKAK